MAAPGQGHFLSADGFVKVKSDCVADCRFIREEPGDHAAKQMAVMGKVRLIDMLNLQSTGLFVQHIDIIIPPNPIVGGVQDVDLPVAVWYRPVEFSIFYQAGQVDRVGHFIVRFRLPGDDMQKCIIIIMFFVRLRKRACRRHDKRVDHLADIQLDLGARPADICTGITEILLAQLIGRLFDTACGKAGREVGVVQNPDLHIQFLRFFQDDIQVVPPAVPGKIRVGARFETDCPAS